MPVRRECEQCESEFFVKPHVVKKGWGRFCSKSCQYEARKIYRRCQNEGCDNMMHVRMFEVERGRDKYCSRKCAGEALSTRVRLRCDQCGKCVKKKPSELDQDHYYCSRRCADLGRRKKTDWRCGYCKITLEEAIAQHAEKKNLPNKSFEVSQLRAYREARISHRFKYCSKLCAGKARRGVK